LGNNASVFQCSRRTSVSHYAPIDDNIGFLSSRFEVALLLDHVGGQVGAQIIVDERSVRFQSLLQIYDGVEWFIIDENIIKGVFSDVAALSDDDGKGIANVVGFVLYHRDLGAGVKYNPFYLAGRRND
jgi:hypothetical protein